MIDRPHDSMCFSRSEPLATYLAQTEYASSSTLRRFLRTGVAQRDGFTPTPPEASLGDALHALVLEPDRFEQDFARVDEANASITSADELMARTWLNSKQSLALRAMQKSLRYYTRLPLQGWLDSGNKELSIYWTDAAGAKWKARPDCFNDEVILELKTTIDVRPKKFSKARRHFGYDLQAAHYLDGVSRLTGRAPRFLFVSVESVKPHTVWVHEFDAAAIEAATAQLTSARDKFLAAMANPTVSITSLAP